MKIVIPKDYHSKMIDEELNQYLKDIGFSLQLEKLILKEFHGISHLELLDLLKNEPEDSTLARKIKCFNRLLRVRREFQDVMSEKHSNDNKSE